MSKLNISHEPTILRLHQEGKSVSAIAIELCVSPATLYNYIERCNLFSVKGIITEEIGARLIQYRKDGLTLASMSDKEGFSIEAISRYLIDKGFPAQLSKTTITGKVGERLIQGRKNGSTLAEMAAVEGSSPSTISRYLIDKGISNQVPITEEIGQRLIQYRKDGLTLFEMSNKEGPSPSTISTYLVDKGFSIQKKITDEIGSRLIQYRKDSFSLMEMSDKEGLNPQVISRYLSGKGFSTQSSRVNITEELAKRIVEMNASGEYFIDDIAAEIGCAKSTVSRYLERNNIQDNSKKRKVEIDEETGAKIIERFNQRWGRRKIAEEVGLDAGVVARFLKTNELKRERVIPEDKLDQIAKLIEDGYNYSQIAEKLTVTKQNVRDFCINHNLFSKKSSEEEKEAKVEYKRIRKNISNAVHRDVKEHLCDDEFSINDAIPWTITEFKAHMEYYWSLPENLTPEGKVWMTMDNWGVYRLDERIEGDYSTYKWHLDHVKPLSEFHYTSISDPGFAEAWVLSNLRPLEAKENVVDGARRTRHEEKPGYVPTYFTAEDLKEAQAKEKAIPKELNDTEKKILELYHQGYGRLRIMKELNLSEGVVRSFFKRQNLSRPGNPTKLTSEMADQIPQLIQQGLSFAAISRQIGLSQDLVRKFCRRNNLESVNSLLPKKAPIEFTQEVEQRIIEMNASGNYYIRNIAQEIGCTDLTISNFLERKDIPNTCKKVKVEFDEEASKKIIDMFNLGCGAEEIGKEFEVSSIVIYRFFKEHDLKREEAIPETKADNIRQWIEAGQNYAQIARELNVDPSTVSRFCAKQDISLKNPISIKISEGPDILCKLK